MRDVSKRVESILRAMAIVVVSLGVGYALFRFIRWSVDSLWMDVPGSVFGGRAPWWYLLSLPAVAGLVVAWSRSRGSDGHNPLFGFSREPVEPGDFPWVLLNILASLAGGLVLGPEMALVAVGSVVGVVLTRGGDTRSITRASGLGSLAALAALAVDPLRTGHLDFSAGYSFNWWDLLPAALASAVAVALIALVRVGAFGLMRLRGGDRAIRWQLALGGLVVGGLALGYQTLTDRPVDLVLTSGEQLIAPMVALGSVGLIALTVVVKLLGYLVSQGMGFRGGPYFPVMFAGAGVGAIAGTLITGSPQAAGLAGLLATTLFLAKPPWPAVLVLALVVGVAFGGMGMLPAAVLGAAIGKLIPRIGEPVTTPRESAQSPRKGTR